MKQPGNESTKMGKSVVQGNLDDTMYAAVGETEATAMQLEAKGDVFPERRDRRKRDDV